jgi:glycosyltransferase involved in cell wall biosynthesis
MNTVKDFGRYKDNFVVVHQGSDQPEISVVMPVYNCEEFVADAVTSILTQQKVVVEILISDDASTDNTFEIAYQTVVDYCSQSGTKHTVLMRAGTSRLVRDHLHLVAETASSDLVCQAHGDDISHPLRCSLLVKAFNQEDRKVSMVFVDTSTIDQQGKPLEEPKDFSLSSITADPVKYDSIVHAQASNLIGCNMAWRRSSFKDFPKLTTSYCAYGHDRVMTFRSFLVGGCFRLDASLLQRRIHKNQLHKESISFEHTPINMFNYQIIRLCLFSAMKKDLTFLKENNLIRENDFTQHCNNVDGMIVHTSKCLADATNNLVVDGYVNNWLKKSSNNALVDQ